MLTLRHLPGNLRLAYQPGRGEVEYFGVAVDAGSRDEPSSLEGLAHFVEHTIFKGTLKRRSWHILNRMEAVGGELNAYTTKEETMVYTIYPRGNFARAAELVADLITSSTFPEAELDREREVVADEINSYLDSPAESVYDDFEDLMFAGTPLGHNILGQESTLSRFTSAECRRWLDRYYTASNMVLFYMGNLPVERVEASLTRYFGSLCRAEQPAPTPSQEPTRTAVKASEPFNVTRSSGNHQAHTVMGCPLPDIYSQLRLPLALLTNLLGGPGMNSLLNLELRERRGLVYSVEATSTFLSDIGMMQIYFGCDPADTPRCKRTVENVLRRLSTDSLSERRLAAAKKQFAGQLIISTESREQMALNTARSVLYRLPVKSLRDAIDEVYAITPADIQACQELLIPERFSSLTLS